jgi:hypothetical protein
MHMSYLLRNVRDQVFGRPFLRRVANVNAAQYDRPTLMAGTRMRI